MKLKSLSLAAVAAFVFAGSLVASASAASPCTACWIAYERCTPSPTVNCESRLTQCLRRNNCPL